MTYPTTAPVSRAWVPIRLDSDPGAVEWTSMHDQETRDLP